jgi:hypothetical membrane protein
MIKLACGILGVVCLLAAAVVLWLSPVFPENLPPHLADWAVVWFKLFKNPGAAAMLLSVSLLLFASAMCIADILLGILFSLVAALFAVLCLLGALGSQFAPVAKSLEQLFR